MEGADVFVGAAGPGALQPSHLQSMAKDPVREWKLVASRPCGCLPPLHGRFFLCVWVMTLHAIADHH